MSRMNAVVVGVVVVAVLILALPATAQTKVESFTTALDSSGSYFHRTTYTFTMPSTPAGHPAPDVTLDIYYNSRNVWLVRGELQCSDLSWGAVSSDTHFASVRTTIPANSGTTCQAYLAFANNVGRTTPQSAAVRLNVAVGGQRALTKQAASADGLGRSLSPLAQGARNLEHWLVAMKEQGDVSR